MRKIYAAISIAFLACALPARAGTSSEDHVPGAEHIRTGHSHADASVGKPGDPAKVSRTAVIEMSDTMRFSPATILVKRGEVVRFVVKNSGKLKHEMVIGSSDELKEHARMMAKFPEMEHAEANQVTLDPGKTGELLWMFDRAGKVEFACLQPGHLEAGMKGVVRVSAK